MVLATNYSIRGRSHISTAMPCQDASLVQDIVGSWVLMVTADGVGSCRNSQTGSDLAVKSAAAVIVNSFPNDGKDKGILALIRTAFNCAMRSIIKRAEKDGEPVESYDTTLDVAIYNGSRKLYYGHCGDGGIFVLNGSGEYKEITSVQEGEESNSVKPLRFGNDLWEIGVYEDDEIGAVASFTDGIRDKLVPPQFRDQKYTIDVNLANIFMFADVFGMNESEAWSVLEEHINRSVDYLRSAECTITDDVTMGLMINTDVPINDPPYEEPDHFGIEVKRIDHMYPNLPKWEKRHLLELFVNDFINRKKTNPSEKEDILDRYYRLEENDASAYAAKYHNDTVPVSEEAGKENAPVGKDEECKAYPSVNQETTKDEEQKPDKLPSCIDASTEEHFSPVNEKPPVEEVVRQEDGVSSDNKTGSAVIGSDISEAQVAEPRPLEVPPQPEKQKNRLIGKLFRGKNKKNDTSSQKDTVKENDVRNGNVLSECETERRYESEEEKIARNREAVTKEELDISIANEENAERECSNGEVH